MRVCGTAVRPDRLQEALRLNEPLAMAYYLKEDLRQIWWQADKRTARRVLHSWLTRARASGVRMLVQFADTLEQFQGVYSENAFMQLLRNPLNPSPLVAWAVRGQCSPSAGRSCRGNGSFRPGDGRWPCSC
jgi:transposase